MPASLHNLFLYAYVGLTWAIIITIVALGVVGAIHAAATRPDAFMVISREKQNWIMLCAGAAILGVMALLTTMTMLWVIGAVIVGIYWQDIFPSIRDVLNNSGGW